MITAITPTGDRPLAFALCQQWMQNQTLKPDQWIVVDDGKVPMEHFAPMEYVRREPRPDDPKHTLLLNLRAALPRIKGNKILIIEDDEYYAPGYIEEMSLWLDKHEVVGIGRSKYYNLLSGGYHVHGNMAHASLAETGFRRSFLPDLEKLLNNGNVFLDVRLWQTAGKRKRLFVDAEPLYLGIKGLPGRPGIGVGHDKNRYSKFDNANRDVLRKWVPKDYQIYIDIMNGKQNGLSA